MKAKWLLSFALLGLSVAGARSYDIVLSNPSKAGSLQLERGSYRVAVEGNDKVRFKDMKTGKEFETAAKIEDSGRKFSETAVESRQVNGSEQIQEIDLAGTRTKVEFN